MAHCGIEGHLCLFLLLVQNANPSLPIMTIHILECFIILRADPPDLSFKLMPRARTPTQENFTKFTYDLPTGL